MKYHLVACGGTFDLLHQGHKDFLKFASIQGDKFIVGLTSDKYLSEYKSHISPQSLEIRKQALEDFFKESEISNYEIVPIDDPYGPPIFPDLPFDAIVVTSDTYSGAEAINEKRKENGLLPLDIITFELSKVNQEPISSTNIRQGLMNTSGDQFIQKEWFEKDFVLPQKERETLHEPFGELITDFESWKSTHKFDETKIVSVGDETTKTLHEHSLFPQLSIIDFKIKRQNIFHDVSELKFSGNEEVIKIYNPAAHICGKLIQTIYEWFQGERKKTIILIDGEEDLAVLPVLLASPLGYSIFYGQPNEGMIYIHVTEDIKEKALIVFKVFD